MTSENFRPNHTSSGGHVFKEMGAGAIGMATASLVLNPLDVLKVRIQSEGSFSARLLSCAKTSIVDAGGILRGLILPGLTATLVRDILNGAFRVGLYKEIERGLFPVESTTPVVLKKALTGVLVGSTGAGLWSHTDLIKTRMQLQNPRRPIYSSTWDAYRQAVIKDGIVKGLYRGVGPNMLRASIITTTHVGSYDYSKQILVSRLGDTTLTWTICGFFSALLTTTAAAPVDLVRTRIMAQSGVGTISAWQVAKNVIAEEGFRGLFRGWIPSFARFGPHFTISWPLIELSRQYIFGIDSF